MGKLDGRNTQSALTVVTCYEDNDESDNDDENEDEMELHSITIVRGASSNVDDYVLKPDDRV